MLDKVLSYKGLEFKVVKHGEDQFKAVVNFAGGCEWAGSRGTSEEDTIIRFTTLLNQTFIQPAVTAPRVGDLLDVGTDDRNIIVRIDAYKLDSGVDGIKIKSVPLKDVNVFRHVHHTVNGIVQPYLRVDNKVADLSNEFNVDFPSYVILEDGVLMTNNHPVDVFVWKGKLEE